MGKMLVGFKSVMGRIITIPKFGTGTDYSRRVVTYLGNGTLINGTENTKV